MATNWGLYCKTCNEPSYNWFRRDWEKVQELAALWPELKEAWRLVKSVEPKLKYLVIDYAFEIVGSEGDNPLSFMEAHEGHELMLKDEYGYIYFLNCDKPQGNYNAVGSVLDNGHVSWR